MNWQHSMLTCLTQLLCSQCVARPNAPRRITSLYDGSRRTYCSQWQRQHRTLNLLWLHPLLMNDGFRERYDDDVMESVVAFVKRRKHGKLISHILHMYIRFSSSIFATSLRSWYGRVRQKRARQDTVRRDFPFTMTQFCRNVSQNLASHRVTYCEPGLRSSD